MAVAGGGDAAAGLGPVDGAGFACVAGAAGGGMGLSVSTLLAGEGVTTGAGGDVGKPAVVTGCGAGAAGAGALGAGAVAGGGFGVIFGGMYLLVAMVLACLLTTCFAVCLAARGVEGGTAALAKPAALNTATTTKMRAMSGRMRNRDDFCFCFLRAIGKRFSAATVCLCCFFVFVDPY